MGRTDGAWALDLDLDHRVAGSDDLQGDGLEDLHAAGAVGEGADAEVRTIELDRTDVATAMPLQTSCEGSLAGCCDQLSHGVGRAMRQEVVPAETARRQPGLRPPSLVLGRHLDVGSSHGRGR